jgi:hypothetical protein
MAVAPSPLENKTAGGIADLLSKPERLSRKRLQLIHGYIWIELLP